VARDIGAEILKSLQSIDQKMGRLGRGTQGGGREGGASGSRERYRRLHEADEGRATNWADVGKFQTPLSGFFDDVLAGGWSGKDKKSGKPSGLWQTLKGVFTGGGGGKPPKPPAGSGAAPAYDDGGESGGGGKRRRKKKGGSGALGDLEIGGPTPPPQARPAPGLGPHDVQPPWYRRGRKDVFGNVPTPATTPAPNVRRTPWSERLGGWSDMARMGGMEGVGGLLGGASKHAKALEAGPGQGGAIATLVMEAVKRKVDAVKGVVSSAGEMAAAASSRRPMEDFGIAKSRFIGHVGEMAGVGPIVKPVAKFAEAIYSTIKTVRDWGDNLAAANEKFAEFSPAMAAVAARQQVRDINLSRERGERRAGAAEELNVARNELNRRIAVIEDSIVNKLTPFLTRALRFIDWILERFGFESSASGVHPEWKETSAGLGGEARAQLQDALREFERRFPEEFRVPADMRD
jgi:hypothetical protein